MLASILKILDSYQDEDQLERKLKPKWFIKLFKKTWNVIPQIDFSPYILHRNISFLIV